MTDILLYSLIAAAALFFSGAVSSWVPIGEKATSFFQHFAAGVVFAAVALELLPLIMKSELKFDIAIGFLFGLGAMLLIRLIDQKSSSSLGMVSGIGIDLLIDGILIGLAFSASEETGALILIALTIEVLFLGLSLMPSMTKDGISAFNRYAALAFLALLIPAGAALGTGVVALLPPTFFEAALAFGACALLYLVTEELLVEAHETTDTPWTTAAFFIGFLAIMCLH